MQEVMGIITEGDRSSHFKRVMTLGYPNFNKEGVDVISKHSGIDGVMDYYVDKNDPNLLYARYWDMDKELQLSREVFDFLENFTNEEIFDEVINWFNNEFGTDAEYVTY